MHSSSEIPGIHHHHHHHRQQQQPDDNSYNNSCDPVLLSMNQTHILEQIHTLPETQQLFLDQHHFFQPQSRLSHHHQYTASSSSSAFLPVNFKLGLNNINEICCPRNNNNNYYYNNNKDCNCVSSSINEDASFVRGSEQFEVPEACRQYSSLGMLHSWQDSAIKQQPFWEPLPSEVSNENSEIVDKQENLDQMNQKEPLTTCLDSKTRVHFSELEAIYNRLNTNDSIQTRPIEPTNNESNEESKNTKKRKKKKKKESSYNQMINPMAKFIENLVKRVIEHQENLHKKFNEVIERLDLERRVREEAMRTQELEHFEQEAKERAKMRFLAENREAIIVSYLEKITGQKINFPTFRSD